MGGQVFPFDVVSLTEPRLGLIALQSDETIERDMRFMLPDVATLFVSRVPSDVEVTSAKLSAMENHLSASASLFPLGASLDAVGYGCTSGTAQIGVENVASKVRAAAAVANVTQPLTSLIEACGAMGLSRIALLSPYVAQVSKRLQDALAQAGISTPVFGSFEASTEATVVRISPASITDAAVSLMSGANVDALFISCTNLRTMDVIEPLEARLGKPVLTSNQVLAWHMMRLAGTQPSDRAPGRLFRG